VELYRGKDKYKNLEEDGIVSVESFVNPEEVLVVGYHLQDLLV
jgi:hypothetical protein